MTPHNRAERRRQDRVGEGVLGKPHGPHNQCQVCGGKDEMRYYPDGTGFCKAHDPLEFIEGMLTRLGVRAARTRALDLLSAVGEAVEALALLRVYSFVTLPQAVRDLVNAYGGPELWTEGSPGLSHEEALEIADRLLGGMSPEEAAEVARGLLNDDDAERGR